MIVGSLAVLPGPRSGLSRRAAGRTSARRSSSWATRSGICVPVLPKMTFRTGSRSLVAIALTHCRPARLLPERPAYPALGSRHRLGDTSPRLVRGLRPRDRQKIRVPLGNFRNLHSQSPTIEPTLGSAKSGRYRGISHRGPAPVGMQKSGYREAAQPPSYPAFGIANLAKSAASNAKRNGAN